jgi:hypothetical protein
MKAQAAGIVAGLVLGVVAALTGEQVSHMIHPDFSIPNMTEEQLKGAFAFAPEGALMLRILGWALAPALGTWAALRLANGQAFVGLFVGLILVSMGMLFAFLLPYPAWARLSLLLVLPISLSFGILIGRKQMRERGGVDKTGLEQ